MTKRSVLWVCLSIVLPLLFWGVASSVGDEDKVVPHIELNFHPFTLEEKIREASPILTGRVEGIGDLTHPDVFPSDVAFLLMEVSVSVSRRIKGQCPEEISLVTYHQDPTIVIVEPPTPHFTVGEELLLIISPTKGGYYTIGPKGKYTILDGKIVGSEVVVEDFIRQIQELVAGVRSQITLDLPGHPYPRTSTKGASWGQIKSNFKE